MPPKKPFRRPKIPKKPPKPQTVLVSAQDYLDQGVEEEESGDRWLLSDLSKSLRFYQKAYEYYIIGGEKNPKLVDCFYNANRLLFHIYDVFQSIPIIELKNIEGCNILNYSIGDIKNNYEAVIKKFNELGEEHLINWEFYYNLVLIDTEWIEKSDDLSFDQVEVVLKDSTQILNRILDYQLNELDQFVRRLENPEEEVRSTNEGNEGENEESFEVIQQITPSIMFETCLSSLKMIQAGYESTENDIQLNYLKDSFSPFISRLDTVFKLILSKFAPSLDNEDQFNINLTKEEVEEFHLITTYIEGLFIKDFEALKNHWSLLDLEGSSSRYLIQADSYNHYKDNNLLTSEQLWDVISFINQVFKKAQELVRIELQENINAKTNKVSEKVSKSIEILIDRADNELVRSSLTDLEVAIKNQDALKQNAINLLKNGLTLSNTNCGLRESVSDRLRREKLRRECTVRLVVITKAEFTESDFITNLRKNYYYCKAEISELETVDVYKPYFGQ